jgi:hypothetical protein
MTMHEYADEPVSRAKLAIVDYEKKKLGWTDEASRLWRDLEDAKEHAAPIKSQWTPKGVAT